MDPATEAVKKKPTQTDEGELFIGTVPKIKNYQTGKIYLYQSEKDRLETGHRADILRLGFSQLRDLLQSILKTPDQILGKKKKYVYFQKRIDRSRSTLVKVKKIGAGYKIVELLPIVHDRKLSAMNLHTYWEKEEPAIEAVKISEPTKEMFEFFKKRTAEHIKRASNNIDVVIKAFPDLDKKVLEERRDTHDDSKYEEEEYLPYVWMTEYYRAKNKGEKFEYPPGVEEKVEKAWKHHAVVNKHHPEAHVSPTAMSKEDLADMVADWAAMSQEFDTSLKKWADDNVGKKWKFSKDQVDFIYSVIDVFEKPATESLIFKGDPLTSKETTQLPSQFDVGEVVVFLPNYEASGENGLRILSIIEKVIFEPMKVRYNISTLTDGATIEGIYSQRVSKPNEAELDSISRVQIDEYRRSIQSKYDDTVLDKNAEETRLWLKAARNAFEGGLEESPALEYVIKPEDTRTLWYENAKGDKWYYDRENPDSINNPPKGFIYQVSKRPNEVRENMLREVLPEEVEKCKHPEDDIRKTYGWVDGMEGRECALCKGTQIKKVKDKWPEKWEAHGSRNVLTMSTSWTEAEVMALVNDAGYKLHEAIQLATSMCGRCISALLYDNDSKESEFSEFSLDWFNENVSCKHCEEHRMEPVTEDKLRRYRSNAPDYLKLLDSRIGKGVTLTGADGIKKTVTSDDHWKIQRNLVKNRLAEYEKELGKLWKTDLSKSPVATEAVSSINFNSFLGKPISTLTEQIESFEIERKTTKTLINDIANDLVSSFDFEPNQNHFDFASAIVSGNNGELTIGGYEKIYSFIRTIENKSSRNTFSKYTNTPLPKTVKGTTEALDNWAFNTGGLDIKDIRDEEKKRESQRIEAEKEEQQKLLEQNPLYSFASRKTGKSSAMQVGKIEQALGKKFNYSGIGVKSRKEFVEYVVENGGGITKYDEFNESKYEKWLKDQQFNKRVDRDRAYKKNYAEGTLEQFLKDEKEQFIQTTYEAEVNNKYFKTTKTEFEYAQFLKNDVATEKVNGVDFNSALGKPFSYLQELIELSDIAVETTEQWIDNIAKNKANLGKLPIDLKKSIEDTEFRPFGAWKGEAVKGARNKLSPKQRLVVNKKSEDILKKSRQDMTEADLETLQQYSGFGGTKSEEGEEIETGILYDYYTSPPVALAGYKIIDSLFKIKPGMTACEPSCGNGVYMEVAPPGLKMTGIEYDARSSACADSLHDNAKVHNSSFEEFNLHSKEEFDLVIGNAPFGDRSGDTQYLDDPDEKNMDRYFLKASLKKLKPGGMLGLIVHSGVFENDANKEWRKELLKIGEFQGAIRLPSESFQHTDTQVSPDMIFFKKHYKGLQDSINLADDFALEQANVFGAKEWIEGSKSYYQKFPKHKLGEDVAGNFGRIYTKGKVTANKLDSSIAAFEQYQYSINWQAISELRGKVRIDEGPPVKKLSESEAKAVANKDLRKGKIKIEEGGVYMLNDKYEWEYLVDATGETGEKIGRVMHISQIVRQIRTKMQNDEPVDSLQKDGKELIQQFKNDYDNWQYDDKDIKRFFKQNSKIAGFEGVDIDIDHEILTKQNIYQKKIKYKDGHNIAIKALLSYQDKNILEVSTEQVKDYAPTFEDALIDECYNNKDIFLDPDLKWQLRENFIQGNAWDKVEALERTLNEEKLTPEDIEKLEYSISELKSKASWISLEDIAPRPFDKWLPRKIVTAWLNTHDMGSIVEYDKGKSKWDARDWSDKLDPEGAKYMRFLNRESQRGDTDTKRYNETKTEDFERFIATNEVVRAKIEDTYNKLYGGKIKGPNKTYPIDIDGWNEKYELFPHQWQSVHHLARMEKGTNGSFVGSGKTPAQIALFSLLRQEGKVKRGFGQVPNNKVRDWVNEFKKFTPGIKVGYIDAKGEELDDADRNRRLQKLANGSYDIIILPESIATRLGLDATTDAVINEKVVLLQTKDDKSVTQRTQVKSKEAAAKRVRAGDLRSNQTVVFDDFNFDFMFIDESHNGKAIFKSKKSRGLGFKGGRESNRAMAMFKKMEAVRLKTGGKYTFGNTATPISNSPIELFNQMHLMGGGDELQRRGIFTIDDFIDEFCEVEETVMVDWATSKTKVGKKLVGFTRVDKLQEMFREYVDYQHDPDAVDLKKPTATYIANEIPVNEVQKDAVVEVRNQLKEWKNDKDKASTVDELIKFRAKWGGANYLTFFSKLRTASLDLELFDPGKYGGWKNPKLETLAKNAWDNFERTGGGQVVFCDRVLSSKGDFSMHNKIKDALVQVGFKSNEIVIVNGQVKGGLGKAKLKESKLESVVTKAIDGFNAGRYRVIIGTTNTLGEGVNLQENSGGLHHFDIPYRPSDFIQRNGRIDRQGNDQKRVELNTYVSKGSIDSYSKGIVSDKENWINQLLNTTSNVFANPDEGFDENSLELAMAEEFDTPEHVAQLKIDIAEKQKQAELDYNKNQVDKVLPKFELISGAIWEYKGDKGSQVYQNMLRKREEYSKDLEKNPEFKNPELLEETEPFYFDKEAGAIYRQGDYFISDKGIHQLTKVNSKKGTMELTPIDETWKKTQGETRYIPRQGSYTPPDHTGYIIKGKLPSKIKHAPDLKTPERLAQTQTVFADEVTGFYEQPLDFQIDNYKDFFKNRKKEEVPFYFKEQGDNLILDSLDYSDKPQSISSPIHPEKAIKVFEKRLLDGTARIKVSQYRDEDIEKVIAKVGRATWDGWKRAEQQGEHPWLSEAYKLLDRWMSREDLKKELANNEDFKNDTDSNKIASTLSELTDIESKDIDRQRFYIKKSQLKRGMDTEEDEIYEVATKYSQLSLENLETSKAAFFKAINKIRFDIETDTRYYKMELETSLNTILSVKGNNDEEATVNSLIPPLKEYYKKKSKSLFDEENEIRKSQGMDILVEMSDEDIRKNLEKQIDGFRAEQMAEYEPQGEESAKYFTLRDMVKKFDDYKLKKEFVDMVSLNADNKADIERVTNHYIKEKKVEIKNEFETFIADHKQKIKTAIDKFLADDDRTEIEIKELRDSLPFHTPISDSDFRTILTEMEEPSGFTILGNTIRTKDYKEPVKVPEPEPEKVPGAKPGERPELETVKTEDTDLAITDFTHTKTGELFRLVKMVDKVSKDRFSELRSRSKQFDGYYNRWAKGFMFKDPEQAREFAQSFEV